MSNETGALKRTFGMREAVTITVGTVVGVVLFTTGANVVGDLGPAVILATLVAMLISIYPALLYMEEEIPTAEEKRKMDKEFRIWSIVVTCAVIIALVAYVVPFVIS